MGSSNTTKRNGLSGAVARGRNNAQRWQRRGQNPRFRDGLRILALHEVLPRALDGAEDEPPVLHNREAKRPAELLAIVRCF